MRLQNQLSDDLRASREHVPVDFAPSPTPICADERLDFVVQTVRQLSIRLKRVECKLEFLTAERRKQHAEDVEIAVFGTEFRLPPASEVDLMELEAKLQDSDTCSKLVSCRYESQLFSGELAVNLRWVMLWRSGSSRTHKSYLGSICTSVQPTWTVREDWDRKQINLLGYAG
ncbi:hypothetical protein EG68_09133 [Paragonimus skrjabini miyazakii]|uniref:Uncharacterized protein n=1 Tax=Paragonimus skrjabini miyazakii TaxID=59628 RepID=A0A8S9Y936_9TREM|nr:hypothetical protein EG68_09133 [Paragonimus skrjabini miyazakii]